MWTWWDVCVCTQNIRFDNHKTDTICLHHVSLLNERETSAYESGLASNEYRKDCQYAAGTKALYSHF